MCSSCECSEAEKPIQFTCDCKNECGCGIIEFKRMPDTIPYCCSVPMKRVK